MSLFCDYCNVAFPSGCICGKISLYKLWAPELDKVNKLQKENAKLRECVDIARDGLEWCSDFACEKKANDCLKRIDELLEETKSE